MYSVKQIIGQVFAIEEGNTRMYLLTGSERALLLDTGLGTGDLRALVSELTDLEVDVALTHGHFDHTGCIGQFDTIFVNNKEWAEIKETFPNLELDLRDLDEGDSFDLGDRRIQVLLTAGHTEGSLSFFDEKNRILFSGDNVSDRPVFMCLKGADVTCYRATLEKIISLSDKYDFLLGCHGKAEQSVDQAGRLLELLDAIDDGRASREPVTVYSGEVFDKYEFEGAAIYL